MNSAPSPGVLSTRILLPCTSTMDLAIARPNPQSTPGANFPGGGFQSGNPPAGMQPPSGSGSETRPNFPPDGGGGRVIIQGGPGMGGDAGSAVSGQMLQGTPDPSMQATAQARFSTQASQVNTMLLNVLINKLEAMATK